MFQSENSFLQGLIYIYICQWPDIFLCLTLQKTVFRSLPFHISTQFGEQIAIPMHNAYVSTYINSIRCTCTHTVFMV